MDGDLRNVRYSLSLVAILFYISLSIFSRSFKALWVNTTLYNLIHQRFPQGISLCLLCNQFSPLRSSVDIHHLKSLTCLRLDLPGSLDRILFDFYAQNQVPGGIEHLHWSATYRVREGEEAAIIGYPIFVGLNVGSEGVAFRCLTVNVKNEDDDALLGFLESDVFKVGLGLATTAQPAIAPLSGMTVALTKSIAGRHKNVPVQDFYMGLDFTEIAFRARLAEGSYLAVQIPEALGRVWDWNEWVYHPKSGQVVSRDDEAQLIPYNFLVFSVSRYAGD